MEPKFREIVRRDPNIDLKNIPISEWPAPDKVQAIAGGPIYTAINTGVFDKVWNALKRFTSAFNNYNGKMVPMWPKAGMSKDPKTNV